NVKILLSIEDTDKDDYLREALPIVISLTETYCGKDFAVRNPDGTMTQLHDGYVLSDAGIIMVIAKILEFYMNKAGVTQEVISRTSFMFTSDLPKSLIQVLNTYREVKFY